VSQLLIGVPEPFTCPLRGVTFGTVGWESGRQPFRASPRGHDLSDKLLHASPLLRGFILDEASWRIYGSAVTEDLPMTLQQALAHLKRAAEARRRLRPGTAEYVSTLAQEVYLAGMVYDLARVERESATR
jgi:hypothetical protein